MYRLILAVLCVFVFANCSPTPSKNGNPIDVSATCGNGIVEGDEVCDLDALENGACPADGDVSCFSNCSGFDFSNCGAPESCGNGTLDDGEVCDDELVADGTCEAQGFGPGTLTCLPNCLAFDTAECGVSPDCGNGVLDDLGSV